MRCGFFRGKPCALPMMFVFLCLMTPLLVTARPADLLHHSVIVTLDPEKQELTVEDTLEIPSTGIENFEFTVHAGLNPKVEGTYQLQLLETIAANQSENAVPVERYRLLMENETVGFPPIIRYRGKINHPLMNEAQEYAQNFSRTGGLISAEGVYLSGSSHWLTQFKGFEFFSFDLTITTPKDYLVVSQGERLINEIKNQQRIQKWRVADPMNEAFLIAAKFTEYSSDQGAVPAYAFLRQPDASLANKYLTATSKYIAMYEQLIGPYPYKKFALIENFWETGYGMPSFTLLGSKIIRFPFIINTSYPHEILHNWWGNSVYADYQSGNWAEGLTAYLADHLLKEDQGEGAIYRKETLKRYLNYVQVEKDFPIIDFRSRNSGASQAVGYGKTLMLFNMLRLELGDDVFTQGLQRFYQQFKFKKASFTDIEAVFSRESKRNLSAFFQQWTQRAGAPELALAVAPAPLGMARIVVRQVQKEPSFKLSVPMAITRRGQDKAEMRNIRMVSNQAELMVKDFASIEHIKLDPEFDVFRRMDRAELPPTLGQLFGANKVTLVIPDNDRYIDAQAWQDFADSLKRGNQLNIVMASNIDEIPQDQAVWILGYDNPFADRVFGSLANYSFEVSDQKIAMDQTIIPRKDHSFIVTGTHPKNDNLAVAWIATDNADALPGLARKLVHYGKYSYLTFAGSEPENDGKGQWPINNSPLEWKARENAQMATLEKRSALVSPEADFSKTALMEHVKRLTDVQMTGRGIGTKGLDVAADYIQDVFKKSGLKPFFKEGYFQRFQVQGGPNDQRVELKNVVAMIEGQDDILKNKPLIIGAHYDHLGEGWPDKRNAAKNALYPGADDNASGVSVLLELAKTIKKNTMPKRSILFVAFTGEEWDLKGSGYFIDHLGQTLKASDIYAMINLDAVGRVGDGQFSLFGVQSAYEWVHIARGIGFTTGIKVKSIMDDLGASDHSSFHKINVPAIHLFAGAHQDYHRPSDTVDKIESDSLLKAAIWTQEAALYLAQRTQELKVQLADSATQESSNGDNNQGRRRVSLGTVPDFDYKGQGARVADVVNNSAAMRAGLKKGDILLAIDAQKIQSLRSYSDILKSLKPGQKINMTVVRDDQQIQLDAIVTAR